MQGITPAQRALDVGDDRILKIIMSILGRASNTSTQAATELKIVTAMVRRDMSNKSNDSRLGKKVLPFLKIIIRSYCFVISSQLNGQVFILQAAVKFQVKKEEHLEQLQVAKGRQSGKI